MGNTLVADVGVLVGEVAGVSEPVVGIDWAASSPLAPIKKLTINNLKMIKNTNSLNDSC